MKFISIICLISMILLGLSSPVQASEFNFFSSSDFQASDEFFTQEKEFDIHFSSFSQLENDLLFIGLSQTGLRQFIFVDVIMKIGFGMDYIETIFEWGFDVGYRKLSVINDSFEIKIGIRWIDVDFEHSLTAIDATYNFIQLLEILIDNNTFNELNYIFLTYGFNAGISFKGDFRIGGNLSFINSFGGIIHIGGGIYTELIFANEIDFVIGIGCNFGFSVAMD